MLKVLRFTMATLATMLIILLIFATVGIEDVTLIHKLIVYIGSLFGGLIYINIDKEWLYGQKGNSR